MSDYPFKPGDRVRVWRHYPYHPKIGDHGTVTECYRADEGVVVVRLDDGETRSVGWDEVLHVCVVDDLARLASG